MVKEKENKNDNGIKKARKIKNRRGKGKSHAGAFKLAFNKLLKMINYDT